MNICILAPGRQEDLQPCLALAVALRQLGCTVRLATHARFSQRVQGHHIAFFELPEAAQNSSSELGPLLQACMEAAQDADFLVYTPEALAGPHLLEKLNLPGALAATAPLFSPTGALPRPGVRAPGTHWIRPLNRLSYRLGNGPDLLERREIKAWRKSLDLPARPRSWNLRSSRGKKLDVLYSISPQVFARPQDWDINSRMGGFWTLPEAEYTPRLRLAVFLARPEPAVYVDFGSLSHPDSVQLTDQVLEATQGLGLKVILSTAGPALQASYLTEDVFCVQEVPQEWLLGHVAAFVHQGSQASVAAALRTGTPSVICPAEADHQFWAQLLHRQRLSATPVPWLKLNAARLRKSLEEALQPEIGQRLKPLQVQLLEEDGAGTAARWIQQQVRAR